jgi:hypothetical protein
LSTRFFNNQGSNLGELNNRLDEILKGISEIKTTTAPRRLTAPQRAALLEAAQPFKGQKISILCIVGDVEGQTLASDFVDVFRLALWTVLNQGACIQAAFAANPTGIRLEASHAAVLAGSIPQAANVLAQALQVLGLLSSAGNSEDVEADSILLTIGKKPMP